MKPNPPGYMTTRGERQSYWFYFVGQNIYYALSAGFISTYLAMQGVDLTKVALVLLVVVPYVTVGLLAVGLCLGYRLHVTGKGTEGWGEKVNSVIDQITDTVSDAVRSLRRDKNEKRK